MTLVELFEKTRNIIAPETAWTQERWLDSDKQTGHPTCYCLGGAMVRSVLKDDQETFSVDFGNELERIIRKHHPAFADIVVETVNELRDENIGMSPDVGRALAQIEDPVQTRSPLQRREEENVRILIATFNDSTDVNHDKALLFLDCCIEKAKKV